MILSNINITIVVKTVQNRTSNRCSPLKKEEFKSAIFLSSQLFMTDICHYNGQNTCTLHLGRCGTLVKRTVQKAHNAFWYMQLWDLAWEFLNKQERTC